MIHNLYKHRGETPLECMQRYVDVNPELKGAKMTYLGRLDPMAEGVLLVASGDDVKKKDDFLGLDKKYDFVALFGFATDTYDILGRVMRVYKLDGLDENEVRRVSQIYVGERDQKYPPFSSRTIGGKPMHEWAREESLDQIEIPSKKIKIHELQFHGLDKLSSKELFGRLLMDISKVKGDFRQNETLILWRQMLDGLRDTNIFLGKFSTQVSSGTYVRSIVNDIGNTLGIGACALSITRTKLGEYNIEDSLRF